MFYRYLEHKRFIYVCSTGLQYIWGLYGAITQFAFNRKSFKQALKRTSFVYVEIFSRYKSSKV